MADGKNQEGLANEGGNVTRDRQPGTDDPKDVKKRSDEAQATQDAPRESPDQVHPGPNQTQVETKKDRRGG